jgi:hypothetical protein
MRIQALSCSSRAQLDHRQRYHGAAMGTVASTGVVLDGADGRGHVVTPEAFVQALAAAGPQVRLVVLNACFTAPMAEALLAHVDCVVGMSGAVHDDTARSLAIGFLWRPGRPAVVASPASSQPDGDGRVDTPPHKPPPY